MTPVWSLLLTRLRGWMCLWPGLTLLCCSLSAMSHCLTSSRPGNQSSTESPAVSRLSSPELLCVSRVSSLRSAALVTGVSARAGRPNSAWFTPRSRSLCAWRWLRGKLILRVRVKNYDSKPPLWPGYYPGWPCLRCQGKQTRTNDHANIVIIVIVIKS